MAKIKAFKAVIYNQEKVKDLSRVVCPPYDVISSQKQDYYHELSPRNFIHIILGRDIPGEDKYQRAAQYFKEWLKEGVFTQDEHPAIYFYSQQYSLMGEKKTRVGFISLLHLGEKDSSALRHEHTRREAKEDRLKLIKKVKANLSPIFAVFQDKKRMMQRIYQRHIEGKEPFIEVVDDDKVVHKVWRLDSPEAISAMQAGMREEDVFIADGHHRFEVACAYRDEMKRKLEKVTGDEDFNYLLTYFTTADSRGLSILPIHRLLKFKERIDPYGFEEKLKDYFDVEEFKDKTRFFFLMNKGGRSEHVLGVYQQRKYRLLRLKNVKILNKVMSDKPDAYRTLDVSMLNAIVFKEILGFSPENNPDITYSPNAEELIERVDSDDSCLVFFLNPVRMQQIIAVALKGERMPAKSTYFYPKLLSGLLVNKFG